MRPRYALITAVVLGAAGCTGPAGPADDVAASSLATAQSCAAKLPPAATIIFKDAEPDVHPETNMETLLTVKVMMLIVRDRIKRAEARPAAERAAECLELLQQ